MGIVDTIRAMMGRGNRSGAGAGTDPEEPSHRCESCGEEYFADPSVEITSCRSCGGIRVNALD